MEIKGGVRKDDGGGSNWFRWFMRLLVKWMQALKGLFLKHPAKWWMRQFVELLIGAIVHAVTAEYGIHLLHSVS